MNGIDTTRTQVCEDCRHSNDLKTLYVHLCSGQVRVVEGVSGVEVTQAEIVLLRGVEEPKIFRRRDVYYTCCDFDGLPSF